MLDGTTIYYLNERLKRVINGLDLCNDYCERLDRIKVQNGGKSGLVIAALIQFPKSQRPMRAGEICHALVQK